MYKYIAVLYSIFVFISTAFSQQPYVNNDYGFRINFPDGWKVKTGTTDLIVVSASGGESVEINVGLQGSGIFSDTVLQKIGLEKFAKQMEEQFTKHYQGYKTIAYGQAIIDSIYAFYISYNVSDEKAIKMHGLQYFFVYNSRLYVITAGSPESEFSVHETEFKNSVDSFKFIKQ